MSPERGIGRHSQWMKILYLVLHTIYYKGLFTKLIISPYYCQYILNLILQLKDKKMCVSVTRPVSLWFCSQSLLWYEKMLTENKYNHTIITLTMISVQCQYNSDCQTAIEEGIILSSKYKVITHQAYVNQSTYCNTISHHL